MISFFIFWLVQFPLLLIPTHKLQYMFWVKTVVMPPIAIAMVSPTDRWPRETAKDSGGVGFGQSRRLWRLLQPTLQSPRLRTGMALGVLPRKPLTHHFSKYHADIEQTSVTGGYSTLAVNISDFSRFSKSPRAQIWQLPVIPFFKTIIALFGIISASAAQQIWGKPYWTPLEIIATWQDTPGGRAAAFFCALAWLIAQVSVNISANAVSFANDITAVFPKWFNIRRGTIFVAFVGAWALCPWIIVASGRAFLNFMSAYAIFMAPMAGILFTDYWLVKRRKYDVPALYDPRGIYRYGKYGTNWRAVLAVFPVIIPVLPGLAAKVSPKTVTIDEGLQHLFSFNWLYGFFLSIFIYYFSNLFFPHKKTLIPAVITGFDNVIQGGGSDVESQNIEIDQGKGDEDKQ